MASGVIMRLCHKVHAGVELRWNTATEEEGWCGETLLGATSPKSCTGDKFG